VRHVESIIFALLLCAGIVILASSCVFGGEIDEGLADAIFKAEGGHKATWLYGIKSVSYTDEADARRICLNTIRNHRKRHAKHTCGVEFVECLGNRYCPPTIHPLNKHWVKNVKYFYDNGI